MRPRKLNRPLTLGFLLLIPASVANYLLSHQVIPAFSWGDPLLGLLYGLCIGSLLVGLRQGSKECGPESTT